MDLLRWRLIHLLTGIRARRTMQAVACAMAVVLVLAGLMGPPSAPRNLATVVSWIHLRGLLIVALLAIGNVFCAACPMMLVRDLGRRFVRPTRRWPRILRNKWIAAGLIGAGLFAYEYFDLWDLPRATALLIVGYFAAALLVDLVFTGASFCKFVCPIGQFNFVTATVAPFALQVREPETCRRCQTVDCIKGRPPLPANTVAMPADAGRYDPPRPVTGPAEAGRYDKHRPAAGPARAGHHALRGCELNLFLPSKVGNLDCTLCFDCVRACPEDNIGLFARTPAIELAAPERRSGIGRLRARPDIAALVVVLAFGGLLNAFAMTAPAEHLQHVMTSAIGLTNAAALGVLFVAGLIALPLALIAAAATATRAMTASRQPLGAIATRYTYALVPLGAGVWLAHFGFHALTGVLTIVPVAQRAAGDVLGRAWLGDPQWSWTGVRPGALFPAEIGCILLGALGSAALTYAIANRDESRPARAALPWQALVVITALAAVWTLMQPMAMRGMVMPG